MYRGRRVLPPTGGGKSSSAARVPTHPPPPCGVPPARDQANGPAPIRARQMVEMAPMVEMAQVTGGPPGA